MNEAQLNLAAGALQVSLVPDTGGSVASVSWCRPAGRVDLMRPMSGEARGRRDATGAAMFPMVPFANRICGNRFAFEGRTHRFQPNVPGEPMSLHGTGWQSAWTVARATSTDAELVLDRVEPKEPFSYSASERFVLRPDRLIITIRVINRGECAMPFGFGLHPWWILESNMTLKFRSTHFWLEGPEYIATDRIIVPHELDFSQAQSLPRTWRNNCYSGWDGRAEVGFPNSGIGLLIEADSAFRHLMLYSDPDKSVICLEPQTHASGALNRLDRNDEDDLGIVVLRPGEAIEGTVTFTPYELGDVG